TAPEEERQPRCQFKIANSVGRAGRGVRRVALDAEQELGADQEPFEGLLNADIESAFGSAGRVERQQQIHVRTRCRTTVGPPRQRRKDSAYARQFCVLGGGWARPANKNLPA